MRGFFYTMNFETTDIGRILKNIKLLSATDIFISVMKQSEVQKYIVKLTTDPLRYEFINSEGKLLSDIGGGYSNFTLSLGQKQGRFKVDLYDSGEFHESFRIENISATGFDINSDSVKDGVDLKDRWGKEIEGLTFESVQKAAQFLVNLYFDEILMKIAV